MALKSADAAAPAGSASVLESRRALGLAAVPQSATGSLADQSKEKLVQYSQQAQFVGGKSFSLNEKQWVDAAVQQHPNAKKVRIQFGSAEYFNLVAKDSRVLPWLALGANVQFVLDGTVYEVYE